MRVRVVLELLDVLSLVDVPTEVPVEAPALLALDDDESGSVAEPLSVRLPVADVVFPPPPVQLVVAVTVSVAVPPCVL